MRLQREGQVVEFSRLGRVVFSVDEVGAEHEQGFFDEAAAEAALQVLLDTRRAAGWAEPAEVLEAQQRAAAEAAERSATLAQQLAWYRELTEHADAAAAFRQLAAPVVAEPQLQLLSAEVVKLGDASEHGVTVYFRSGAEADWAGDEVTLYAEPAEREHDRPCLEYVASGGPPLGDDEIEDEVSGDITWFLNEYIYNYWFFTSDEPHRARKWNHDGGIAPDPTPRTPAQVLGDLLLEFVRAS